MSWRQTDVKDPVWFRWLGVAGIELQWREHVLLVDPFLARPPFHRLFFGRVEPDRELLSEHIRQAEVVLITHAHWGHLLDVAPIAESTGAVVVGSAKACKILVAQGISARQVRRVDAGEWLNIGAFRVDVLPAVHGRTPLDWLINGPLPAQLRPPLRLRDYRMDHCFSFRIEVDGLRLLDCPGPAVAAEVLAIGTNAPRAALEQLLRQVRPRAAIPVHWDNLFRPLRQGLEPMLGLPAVQLPPLRRMHPQHLASLVARLAPETRVLMPTLFERYDLWSLASEG